MFSRRHFLTSTAALTLGVAASTKTAFSLPMEPLKRTEPSNLRLSLAAYSLRKYLAPKPDEPRKMDLLQFVEFCKQQGISGVELTSYYFPENVSNDYILKLKRHCHLLGMTISGGAIRNDFCLQSEAQLEKELAHTCKWIDHYALLGAPAIRIFAGNQPKDEPIGTTLARCAKYTETACAYAAEKGVMLALENHGGVTAKAEGLLEIVKQVNSPAFGVNFDSGNFHSTSDPYAELEMIAPYAVNAQIKVEMQVDGKKIEADLKRIVNILRTAKYSGWVALEYEAAEDPLEAIPKWLNQLKPLMDS
jgi:sugar phosphate isomerase/epimerase